MHGLERVLVAFCCFDEDRGQKQGGEERAYYILQARVHWQGSQGNNSRQGSCSQELQQRQCRNLGLASYCASLGIQEHPPRRGTPTVGLALQKL